MQQNDQAQEKNKKQKEQESKNSKGTNEKDAMFHIGREQYVKHYTDIYGEDPKNIIIQLTLLVYEAIADRWMNGK